jgi:hypothetical protein
MITAATHLLSVITLRKVEIQTILRFLNIDSILVRTGLQNQLLQEQERPLVWDLLSNLDRGSPGVVCITLLAVITLLGCNHIFYLECLLNDGALEGLLLDGDLHLDTTRVGFCPDEARIDDSDYNREI